jgi:predicted Zn-dependent protease with MMP-like domain
MTADERERFDRLLESVLDTLPDALHRLLDEAPLVVEDAPSAELLRAMGLPDDDDLCGLHEGLARTERSVEHPSLPDVITLFRRGIVDLAGGWSPRVEEGQEVGGEDAVREEILVTLLHEIGHHFGLDEDDLDRLGYA